MYVLYDTHARLHQLQTTTVHTHHHHHIGATLPVGCRIGLVKAISQINYIITQRPDSLNIIAAPTATATAAARTWYVLSPLTVEHEDYFLLSTRHYILHSYMLMGMTTDVSSSQQHCCCLYLLSSTSSTSMVVLLGSFGLVKVVGRSRYILGTAKKAVWWWCIRHGYAAGRYSYGLLYRVHVPYVQEEEEEDGSTLH